MNELNKLICESIQTVGCLPRCNGEACLKVKKIVANIVKDVREEAIKEFAAELEKRCIEGCIYPAFVKRQVENLVKERTNGCK